MQQMYTDYELWKVNGSKPTDKITDFHSLKLRCSLVVLSNESKTKKIA